MIRTLLIALLLFCVGAAEAYCPPNVSEPTPRMVRQYKKLRECLAKWGIGGVPIPAVQWVEGERTETGACCYIKGTKSWGQYMTGCGTVRIPRGGAHVWMHEATHHHLWLRFRDEDRDHNRLHGPDRKGPWDCWSDILIEEQRRREARS